MLQNRPPQFPVADPVPCNREFLQRTTHSEFETRFEAFRPVNACIDNLTISPSSCHANPWCRFAQPNWNG